MIIAANISLQLSNLGYEVEGIVSRGEEALVYAENNTPDMLLLDINLKGSMDGIETARAIQALKDIPLIYLTANADEATFAKAKQTRPKAFMTKPFNKLDLQRTIELVADQLDTATPPGPRPFSKLEVVDDPDIYPTQGTDEKTAIGAHPLHRSRPELLLSKDPFRKFRPVPSPEKHTRTPTRIALRPRAPIVYCQYPETGLHRRRPPGHQ